MLLRRNLACLFIVCLLCAGCYESKYPLSSPGIPIDPRLLKSWAEQPAHPGDALEKPYRLSLYKFNENECLVAFSNDNGTATIARAFTTMVDTVPVLNLQGIESQDPKDRTFLFFKYAFSADGDLRTWMISSESPLLKNKKFSSQADFAAYFKKHIHDDRLFGPGQKRFTPADSPGLKFFP